MPDQAKPPVFLLDTMSFIFRAYHAMQRSRPMSTRSGLPTAATYVFVNMIRKLRQDFSPQYFAAGFDVSGKVFRDDRAKERRDREISPSPSAAEMAQRQDKQHEA